MFCAEHQSKTKGEVNEISSQGACTNSFLKVSLVPVWRQLLASPQFNWKGNTDGDCCRFDNRPFSSKVRFAIAGRICRSMDLCLHGRLVHRDCAGRIYP